MIVVELKGGLGNQMFQYALGKKLALQNDCPLFLDTYFLQDRRFKKPPYTYRNYELDIFNINIPFANKSISRRYGLLRPKLLRLLEGLLPKGSLLRVEEKRSRFDSEILRLPNDVYLTGYWQSEQYFIDIKADLQRDFTFRKPLPSASQSLLSAIQNTQSVCLHVRRTDYVNSPVHGTLSKSYYSVAEKKLLEEVGIIKVFVFSDDIAWCRNNLSLTSETIFVDNKFGERTTRSDFELMRNCKHFIIPNSSFSWWAAWLSGNENKRVVVPKRWFYTEGLFYQGETVAPKDWIKL